MKNNKYLFIINPKSGHYKKSIIKKIRSTLKKNGSAGFSFKITTQKGEAEKIAQTALPEKHNILIACGGDGTINEVVNGLYKNKNFDKFTLGLLPIGTANVLAKELKIKSVKKALHCIIKNRTKKINIGYIEKLGAKIERKHFVMMTGVGFDSYIVFSISEKLKSYIGKLAYILQAVKTTFKKLPKIKIETENKAAEGFTAIITNGKLYAGRYKIAPHIDLSEQKLEAIILKKHSFASILNYALSLITNKLYTNKNVIKLSTKSTFTITGKEGFPVQADGDKASTLPVKIGFENKKLRVIY